MQFLHAVPVPVLAVGQPEAELWGNLLKDHGSARRQRSKPPVCSTTGRDSDKRLPGGSHGNPAPGWLGMLDNS
jgi:hypothetical protein